jgi:hypothetical protein
MIGRKVVVASLVCILLLAFAAVAALAQAPLINVVAPGKVDISNEQFQFAARVIPLKPGASLGKDFAGKKPLMNLDMKFAGHGEYGKNPVKVWIPLALIEKLAKADPKDAVDNFSIWDKGKWVTGADELKNLGVENVQIEGDYLTFEVTGWPRDDRMIGC